jgi:hypothetical protein
MTRAGERVARAYLLCGPSKRESPVNVHINPFFEGVSG